MSLIVSFKEFFDKGDPLIQTWFMVGTYIWPPTLCIFYIVFVQKMGPALMKNKDPLEFRKLMVIYNFMIVISYLTALGGIAYYTVGYSLYSAICKKVVLLKDAPEYKVMEYAYIMYLLKYVELLDTVFFILRKKFHLVTILHTFHHAILPLLFWVYLRTEVSGYQIIPLIINGCVHVIMYSYYGLAAMGPNVQKYLWWKKYLTMLQMIQFVCIILISCVIVPLFGCQASKYGLYLTSILALLFFLLFHNFYVKTYRKSAEHVQNIQNHKKL